MKKEELLKKFEEVFGDTEGAKVFFAPGRVNLIGEHTDYNGGHVFPCALTIGTYGVARKRQDRALRFYSMNFEALGRLDSSLDDLVPGKAEDWIAYPKGVIWAFGQRVWNCRQGWISYYTGTFPTAADFLLRLPWKC